MSRLRQGIAAGIVVVLAVVVVAAFAQGDDPDPLSGVLPVTSTAVTSTTAVPSSTTSTTSTSTTSEAATTSSIVTGDRVAEVEAILQDLWFRWFDAIYRKDPNALWEVVATEKLHGAGVAAMDATGLFAGEPNRAGTVVEVLDILLDRSDCLVVWNRVDVSAYRGEGAVSSSVDVLWPDPRYGWRQATAWSGPGDLWMNDCDLVTRESTP